MKYLITILPLFRPKVGLNFVDHVVGNQPDKQMELVAKWYKQQQIKNLRKRYNLYILYLLHKIFIIPL